ncbi:ferredoxin [Octadecabacter sp. G9-8]|uniref:Ferredoxin n=1 Tax=Octadecabacter dasysiphoniae TaxID=2909341 RepID=A0ABS9D1J9_9RHOB|nr:ferredoxin [Octadecabacter dasysiphoniae]MCF2872917.1 ferredoxin [Octadecabacter dasysiphoniae]
MNYADIVDACAGAHLAVLGGFHEDGQTTILLGPLEPGFWDHVSDHPAFTGADPLDQWSHAVITSLAETLGADPFFPFGGAPFHPFISWALKSGETWQSPVGLLVHKDAGLLVSYRGALRFAGRIDLPEASASPCDTCATKPCLTACPVDAIGAGGYDVPACKTHIAADAICRAGCRVRLSCPVSQSFGRAPAQTAFHMEAFVKE